ALYNFSFSFTVPERESAVVGSNDPDGIGIGSLKEALGLYRELGDVRGEANVLWGLGNVKYFSDNPDSGVEEFRAALEGFRQTGDRTMEAWALHMVVGALLRKGQRDESRGPLRHALRHFYDAGDAAGISMVI